MRNLLLVILLLYKSPVLYGQGYKQAKLTYKDSIKLKEVWIKYKRALATKDIHTLYDLSLKVVDCDLFQSPEKSSKIPIDTFIRQFYHAFPDLKLWRVIKTKKYHMEVERALYSDGTNVNFKKNPSLMIYYIWYVVFEPNEIAKGHEGESEAFQFMKINGQFKLYGLTSIP